MDAAIKDAMCWAKITLDRLISCSPKNGDGLEKSQSKTSDANKSRGPRSKRL